ncbi:hypothetical protein RQP46_011333 [Phenoliferia psychrophenolica]
MKAASISSLLTLAFGVAAVPLSPVAQQQQRARGALTVTHVGTSPGALQKRIIYNSNLTPDGYYHNRYHGLLSMALYGDALIVFKGNMELEQKIPLDVISWEEAFNITTCHNCTVNAFAANHNYGTPRTFNTAGANWYNSNFNGEAGERGIYGNDNYTEHIPSGPNYAHTGTPFSTLGPKLVICWDGNSQSGPIIDDPACLPVPQPNTTNIQDH